MKKQKQIIVMITAVLFTLSVGYFMFIPQTSAWYYEGYSKDKAFAFGNLDVVLPATIADETMKFRAATQFADKGEILFDNVAKRILIPVENNGNIPARIYTTVTNVSPAENLGLEYFVSLVKDPSNTKTKTSLDNFLIDKGFSLVDYKLSAPTAAYKTDTLAALDDFQHNGYVVIKPYETSYVAVTFWVEYATPGIQNVLENTAAVTQLPDYKVHIRLSVTQDTDGAFDVDTRTINE